MFTLKLNICICSKYITPTFVEKLTYSHTYIHQILCVRSIYHSSSILCKTSPSSTSTLIRKNNYGTFQRDMPIRSNEALPPIYHSYLPVLNRNQRTTDRSAQNSYIIYSLSSSNYSRPASEK